MTALKINENYSSEKNFVKLFQNGDFKSKNNSKNYGMLILVFFFKFLETRTCKFYLYMYFLKKMFYWWENSNKI